MIEKVPIFINHRKDRPSFMSDVHENHISGLLYYLYPAFRKNKNLEKAWIAQWNYNELLEQELSILSPQFKAQNLCTTILKGTALIGLIYQDYGSRFMSDIDLLVTEGEMDRIEFILQKNGYNQIKSDKWHANNFKSEWNKNISGTEITIELHSKLYFHVSRDLQDFKLVDSHLIGYKRLAHEDLLIHLTAHYGLQHTLLKLYWLFDIYLYLKKYNTELDWAYISKRAKELKLNNSLSLCLLTVDKFFNQNYANNFNIQNKNIHFITSNFLWSNQRRSIRYQYIKSTLRDDFKDSLHYNIGWIFSKFGLNKKK